MLLRLAGLAIGVALFGSGCVQITLGGSPAGQQTSVPATPPTGTPSTPSVTPEPEPTSETDSAAPSAAPVDVSAYERAAFISPTTLTMCVIFDGGATCMLPDDFSGFRPDPVGPCEADWEMINGVWLYEDTSNWGCYSDPFAFPYRGSEDVGWHDDTGFGWLAQGEWEFAELPIGQSVQHGDVVCASGADNVRCTWLDGHGFEIHTDEVKFI